MEQIIYVLLLFIFLNCVMKLSLWQWWQRFIYSLALGGFAYWSMDYAMLQSKTRIADYLQNTAVLQNMAIIVTIESVFCLAFTLTYLQNDDHTIRNKWLVPGATHVSPRILPPYPDAFCRGRC